MNMYEGRFHKCNKCNQCEIERKLKQGICDIEEGLKCVKSALDDLQRCNCR